MTDGSDVSPEVSAGGEIWGTLEELLLACAVSRHGTASWESVATEVQTRSPLAARPRLTPRSCRLRFRQLHRRFSLLGGSVADEEAAEGHGEVEGPDASAADGWLDELRRLRVAELRREVERCDLSIGTLQSKVELMKEERERSLSGSGSGSGEATKPEGVTTGDENVSSEEPGRSCRESNSTDLKRPGGVKEEEAKQEVSGESMAASKGRPRRSRRRRRRPCSRWPPCSTGSRPGSAPCSSGYRKGRSSFVPHLRDERQQAATEDLFACHISHEADAGNLQHEYTSRTYVLLKGPTLLPMRRTETGYHDKLFFSATRRRNCKLLLAWCAYILSWKCISFYLCLVYHYLPGDVKIDVCLCCCG